MPKTSICRDQLFLISQLKLTKFDKLCTGIFIFELAPFKQLIFIQMLCHLAQCLKGCIFNGCCKRYLLGFAYLHEIWGIMQYFVGMLHIFNDSLYPCCHYGAAANVRCLRQCRIGQFAIKNLNNIVHKLKHFSLYGDNSMYLYISQKQPTASVC